MRPEQIEQLISDLEYIGLDSEEITYFIAAATNGTLRKGFNTSYMLHMQELTESPEQRQFGWNVPKGRPSIH